MEASTTLRTLPIIHETNPTTFIEWLTPLYERETGPFVCGICSTPLWQTQTTENGWKMVSYPHQKMWILIYKSQWQNRNDFVHKLNEETEATRTRENLHTEVCLLYHSKLKDNLLVRDQHLLERPLEAILCDYDAVIRSWIESFKVALYDRE